jgi:hypothetical protein
MEPIFDELHPEPARTAAAAHKAIQKSIEAEQRRLAQVLSDTYEQNTRDMFAIPKIRTSKSGIYPYSPNVSNNAHISGNFSKPIKMQDINNSLKDFPAKSLSLSTMELFSLLNDWGNRGLCTSSLSVTSETTAVESKVTIDTTLDKLGKMLGELSSPTPANFKDLLNLQLDDLQEQSVEISDQVSKDFIKGVQTVLKAIKEQTTLDMLIGD